jgi:hypothetical protein
VQPAAKPRTCEVEVVELDRTDDVGAIAVSGDEIAWVSRSETTLRVGRWPATGDWTTGAFTKIDILGEVAIAEPQLGRFGPIEGGGFFFRGPPTTGGYLCWPDAACESVTTALEIRDLRVQSGRMAIAATNHVCFTELPDGTPKETVRGELEKLTTADCQGVPANAEGPALALRVAFVDAAASRVWLTARADQGGAGAVHIIEGVNGAPGDPIGVNVAATDGAQACGAEPWALLMKQCSSSAQPSCTLEVLAAESAMPSNFVPNTAVQPDLDSRIVADRDYFYFSTPDVINVEPRNGGTGSQLELNGASSVRSMDASHEDYLFFTYEETIGPLKKYFLGRWRKQKLTP